MIKSIGEKQTQIQVKGNHTSCSAHPPTLDHNPAVGVAFSWEYISLISQSPGRWLQLGAHGFNNSILALCHVSQLEAVESQLVDYVERVWTDPVHWSGMPRHSTPQGPSVSNSSP